MALSQKGDWMTVLMRRGELLVQPMSSAHLLVLQHQAQLIPQVWISLPPMLGHRMVDRLIQDFFFRA
jgi:hypothetical protein